jgi:hypothetical protein
MVSRNHAPTRNSNISTLLLSLLAVQRMEPGLQAMRSQTQWARPIRRHGDHECDECLDKCWCHSPLPATSGAERGTHDRRRSVGWHNDGLRIRRAPPPAAMGLYGSTFVTCWARARGLRAAVPCQMGGGALRIRPRLSSRNDAASLFMFTRDDSIKPIAFAGKDSSRFK